MATSTNSGDDAMVEATQNEEVASVQGAAGMAKDRSLDNLPCCHNDVLASTLPQQPNIHESQIFINACNRTVALNVNLQYDTVEELKHAIQEREGIPVKDQHLVVAGKPLRQGTFLRDYDALGHQSTVDVSVRVRGGAGIQEKTLEEFRTQMQPLFIDEISIPGVQQQDTKPVLSKLGRRILHGVLSCVLTAHEAGLVYGGVDKNNFRVRAYEGTRKIERVVYACPGIVLANPRGRDQLAQQEKDYKDLQKVIADLFLPVPPHRYVPHHVRNTRILLDNLATYIPDPAHSERRTQLLQAHTAMVSSSVGVATMCLNLKRFYEQYLLRGGHQKTTFELAMGEAKTGTTPLSEAVEKQQLFDKVYRYEQNQYKEDTQMDLFIFARNWFTHMPKRRWEKIKSPEGEIRVVEHFKGLPHLDHIFTHHFYNFMLQALIQLYMKFDDHNLLTEVLVPLA